jgi:hypothetical protein
VIALLALKSLLAGLVFPGALPLLLADDQFPLAGRLRIIVVDDASTDGTAAVAGAKVAGYPGARWEKTEKTGQAVSPV